VNKDKKTESDKPKRGRQPEPVPRERGRPVEKPYPARIDASPEEIAETVLRMPPKKRGEWRFEKEQRRD